MIRLENLSKSFAEKVILYPTSYHFPQNERIALVGANGQGKTTLLNILTGQDEADTGIVIKPKSMEFAFLAQSPHASPAPTIREEGMAGSAQVYQIKVQMDALLKRMEEAYSESEYEAYDTLQKDFDVLGGYQLEGTAEKILLGLGFKVEQLDQHPKTLSGGWRMRLELAKVLIAKPDFLILDEPTNHLDLPTIEWLENYLLDYAGTLLFVSHDRAFLNNLATITVFLNQGTLQPYTGNFDSFLRQREQNEETQAAAVKKIEKQQAHMQSFVERFRAKASKASLVASRVKMIERLQSTLSTLSGSSDSSTFHFPKLEITPSGKHVLNLEKLSVGYTKPLIHQLNTRILQGQKIAILGANGIGKSTLLKTMSGLIPPLSGEVQLGHNVQIGHYTQEAADILDKQITVLDTMRKMCSALSEQMYRAVLGAFLFRGNDLNKKVGVLSGGERSRLTLCCLWAQRPNFLLLDEPTNHLDLASTGILAEMLHQYKGTLVFVSHDREFVERIATTIMEVKANGQVNIG